MHYWPNLAIVSNLNAFNIKKFRANRPKGLTDSEWKERCAEELAAKQIALNTVPKASQKSASPRKHTGEK